MSMNKTYWKGLDEKHQTPEFVENSNKEFREELTVDEFIGDEAASEYKTGRRDFLKFLGFGVAAATLASCEAPVIKSIPYVNKPEEITPGVANWYASTFYDGNDFANILVKTREGRPIWIKGNKNETFTKGGVTPRINSAVLNLYNGERLKGASKEGVEISWADADKEISSKLASLAQSGKKVRILSNTIASPTTQLAIDELVSSLGGAVKAMDTPVTENSEEVIEDVAAVVAPVSTASANDADVKHIQYDAVSYSAMSKANEESFGKKVIPSYDFTKAKVVVSLDADFMANWLLHTKYNVDFASTRNPESGWMSKHYHFESVMSLTGANADVRTPVLPSEQGMVAAAILKHLTGKNVGIDINEKIDAAAAKAAEALKAHKGESLVVSGVNNKGVQLLVNAINNALNNYGKTIDLDNPLYIKQGDDSQVEELVNDVINGKVDALVIYGTNPVYTLPNGQAFGEALANIELTVAFSEFADETASKCKYQCPDHNFLESWNDYNPQAGVYTIQQPVIRPMYDTRQAQETMLVWAGSAKRGGKESQVYYDYIQAAWEKFGFPKQTEHSTFFDYWNWSVLNGGTTSHKMPSTSVNYSDTTSSVSKYLTTENDGNFEVIAYQSVQIGEGQYTANPWLQELPDALTKVTWDNYITMAPADVVNTFEGINEVDGKPIKAWNAMHLGQEEPAKVATVTVGDITLTLPVFPLPGQAIGTIGIALGYGRGENEEKIGKAAYQVLVGDNAQSGEYIIEDGKKVPIGKNSYKLTSFSNGDITYSASATVKDTGETYPLACTQTHHTIMGRTSIVRETEIETFLDGNKEVFNPAHELHIHTKGHGEHVNATDVSLWEEHPVEYVGHRWGMSIDLTACNGCGVCIVACHSENNVPVVGKDEVRRVRDMHWLRMDRYFSSIEDDQRAKYDNDVRNNDFSYDNLEVPEENPSVVFMPMMCQHCNHAPCETVCPVAATTHSDEGLNMMAYNRCIGTRYCGNNCPYKVRRFNWFNYRDYKKFDKINPTHDATARLALNPDVVVRSRGVMEKCSFCVQRIQEGKLNAKKEARKLIDGDVVSACADACPTGAIEFGDWNDGNSTIKSKSESDRAYQALEEVGVKPNVWYQVKVRNVESIHGDLASHEGHEEGHEEHSEH